MITAMPDPVEKPGRKQDLRFRMAYTKPELSRVLPFGHTTLETLIKNGVFPDGTRPHPGAHKIWPRKWIEDWLSRQQKQGSS
jgi:hypothetical protein